MTFKQVVLSQAEHGMPCQAQAAHVSHLGTEFIFMLPRSLFAYFCRNRHRVVLFQLGGVNLLRDRATLCRPI